MNKIFVLFKRPTGQKAHAYSVVTQDILDTIDPNIIKATKDIGDVEIIKKADCKNWVEELGGVWYGD